MNSKSDLDNRANQLNPNNDAYWQSRGWEECPEDWEGRVEQGNDKEGTKQTSSK